MADPTERTDRFELIAACDADTLVGLADEVLDGETPVRILQEPKPQLLMHQVREPVERRPFNLGEVVVTAAEVTIAGERGFAMVAGKAESKAVSGAILDAAVAANHATADRICESLVDAEVDRDETRRRQWNESRATTVAFETMEDEDE
ncbi:alpha-D-ribose 1-methylphosphonate 5-triphosphate synthase subunit PhnG [Halogranum rubrum]|uniref:Alpha-D-ribose 1-methylphosphonate 5-triphosphate synthase subunit PhnG n=1 Tax=Halogranum rubrum TaxID=553466 RepID=A0A1I4BHT9_9EURY|nr:phosphonate C-P lyase system protein PhnG [Halogranum rubrum]SFK67860.1 alpha-D-ribose 1-methylphosphonate 5-triphosphate synthase subunit PhnG [Halogranum rubrum]